MNEQEKFDDILRSKLTERDFPFDETNWDKAEEQIDRSDKWKRYGIISLIFLAGIGVGAAIMIPFINNNKVVQTVSVQPTQQNNNSNNSTVASANNSNTQPSNTVANNNSGSVVSGSNPNSQASNTAINNNGSNSVVSTNANQVTASSNNNSHSDKSNASNSGNVQSMASANTSLAANPKTKHNRHHKSVVTDSTAQLSYVRPESERKSNKKAQHNSDVNNNSTLSQNSGNIGSTQQTNNIQSTGVPANNSQPSSNNTIPANNTSTTNNTSTAQTIISKQDSASITKQAVAKQTDSSTNTTQTFQPPKASKNYSHTIFSLDAGGEYAMGWRKEGGTQGSGLNPLFGVSATHYFTDKISAFVGLQYNSLNNMNTLYSNSSSQYDFGVSTDVSSVTLQTIYYLALPVKFQYNLTDNDMFSAGISVLYLVNTRSSVVSYNQNYFGTSGYTATEANGYTDGLNIMDAQATLAYRRKIKRFTVSAEFYYGLLDIEENSFFNNNTFERNNGFRLFLSYDIIK